MKITLTLERDFGHPDNRPTKESLVRDVLGVLPPGLRASKSQLARWEITSVKAED